MTLAVKTIINNPVPSNCHIVYSDSDKHCIVIDPGSEDCTEILSFIQDYGLYMDYIVLTHEHFDHIWAADKIAAPILCSKECAISICDKKCNLSLFYNQIGFEIKSDTRNVEDYGMVMEILGNHAMFFKNMAHSPGGILFTIGNYLISGDMLIKDLKTVTKLKWAKKEELPDCEKWLRLQQGHGYTVLAGHGENFALDDYDINKIY